jgi:hypothetical protein
MVSQTTAFGLTGFLLLAGIVSSGLGAPNEPQVQSQWAGVPMAIDGDVGDWEGHSRNIHGMTKTEFAFRNNAEYLYILLEFKNPLTVSTLEKTGVTIYWSGSGQNKKDNGLKFTRLVLSANELLARRKGQGRKLTDDEVAAIKAKPVHTLFLYDMINKKERAKMATAKPVQYPDFNAAKEGAAWAYEIKIPLVKNENQLFGIGAEPGAKVRIGVEWGGRTEAPTQQESQFMRSITEEDVPGFDSNIRRGQPKYTFWVDVTLATKS